MIKLGRFSVQWCPEFPWRLVWEFIREFFRLHTYRWPDPNSYPEHLKVQIPTVVKGLRLGPFTFQWVTGPKEGKTIEVEVPSKT